LIIRAKIKNDADLTNNYRRYCYFDNKLKQNNE